MIGAALYVVAAFFVLFAIFGLVLAYIQEGDEAAHPLATLLSVAVSASFVLVVLLAPAAVLLAGLSGVGYLYPDAVHYESLWRLFALVLMVALGLLVYELLLEVFLIGLLRHLGLPVSASGAVVEGLLTATLLLAVSGEIVRGVDVSPGAALCVGAASACFSFLVEKVCNRPAGRR